MKLSELGITDPCPFGEHEGGPWNVAFTGPPEGVSCVRCHKTWWKVGDSYAPTWSEANEVS